MGGFFRRVAAGSNVDQHLPVLSDAHEQLTGIPRSYERCMRAIDLLLERGIRMEVKCPAMTINVDELPKIQEWARTKGPKFRTDHNILPQEKGGTEPLHFSLRPRMCSNCRSVLIRA